MIKPSRFRRVFPVFIILFMAPVIVILLFKFGKNTYKELPYYGTIAGFAPNGDTLRHSIPSFSFLDQNNRPYGSDSLKGKIYVVNFFAMSNKVAASKLTDNLKKVQERFRNDKEFRCLSIMLDEPAVSQSDLMTFAKDNTIKTYQWHLLTAPADSVVNLLGNNGFLLKNSDIVKKQATPPYSPVFLLIDKEGHIRGKYIGIDDDNVEGVIEDAHTLFVYYAGKTSK